MRSENPATTGRNTHRPREKTGDVVECDTWIGAPIPLSLLSLRLDQGGEQGAIRCPQDKGPYLSIRPPRHTESQRLRSLIRVGNRPKLLQQAQHIHD